MEALREVLRGSLGRSLRTMEPADRLAAAWTVACGPALAGRGKVIAYRQRTLHVAVEDTTWLAQMRSMRSVLARQVAQSAGLPVDEIQFELNQNPSNHRSAPR